MGRAVKWFAIVPSCARPETLEVDRILHLKHHSLVKFATGSKWGIVRWVGGKVSSNTKAKSPYSQRLIARFPSFTRCETFARAL